LKEWQMLKTREWLMELVRVGKLEGERLGAIGGVYDQGGVGTEG